MVSTAFPEATNAGVGVLARGGNAVDAACAASLALAVCEPQASGIGGQCMALLHVDGSTIAVDGSCRAPSLAHRSMFTDEQQLLLGYGTSTVPGMIATIGYLSEVYGCLDWQDIVEPAIRIAKQGYRITALQHKLQAENVTEFLSIPGRSGAMYFLKDGCVPFDIGDLFIQEDLAYMLEYVAEHGYASFYRGKIASQIDQDMRANGGHLRTEDLARVPIPILRNPVSGRYRGVRVDTIPPPGSGDGMLLILSTFQRVAGKVLQKRDLEAYRHMAEAFRQSLLQARKNPPDPSTYHQATSPGHIAAGKMHDAASMHDADLSDTTHLSVMDGEGNAIGITQSIELVYGSKAAAAGLGFLYNNYMSMFDLQDPASPYFLRPNAVPRSSASPSILFRDERPWIVVGSPGSSRILSAVSLFISHMIDGGASMYDAMHRPRIHCSAKGKVTMEEDEKTASIAAGLQNLGYPTDIIERYSFFHGAIQAVLWDAASGKFQGVAEVRRDGTADGPTR